MNKKEVNELKKQYQKDGHNITRICGCYVNNEKEKISEFKDAFYSLPEETSFKYYEIFKKTLSGRLGRNLLDLAFPLESESEGGTQNFLLKLRNSELTDDELITVFYDRVIEEYDCADNYLILLIHNAYDVPGKGQDGFSMEDASDDVYSYLLCSICPVKLSKPGLSYMPEQNMFQNRNRDWMVDMPEIGFLFPAFTDRQADLHNALYYTKNPDQIHEEFVEEILGIYPGLPAKNQQEVFQTILDATFGEHKDFETIVSIQEGIQERMEDGCESLLLDKETIHAVLSETGVTEDEMQQFEDAYQELIPNEAPIAAANVVTGKVEVKAPGITVQAKPEVSHLLETKKIDGRNCLVIALEGDVTVNGIQL